MQTRIWPRLLVVSAAAALLAAPHALRAADVAVPFRPGETLTYDASWSSFLTAGTVTMRVGDKQTVGGRTGYHLQVEARSTSLVGSLYRVYYKVESLLDASSLAPIQSTTYANERGRERVKSIWFAPGDVANVEIRRGTSQKTNVKMPPHTLDALSAVYVIRALAARPGEVLTMPLIDGTDLSKVRLTFGGRENVKTGLGVLPGRRINIAQVSASGRTSPGRQMTFWLSDDAARRPLRFEAALAVGTVTLSLSKGQ